MNSILEIRKGILFIRLEGKFTSSTYREFNYITSLIEQNGINKVVINLENVKQIDLKGINILLYIYELCRFRNGKSLICGINENIYPTIKKSRLLKYVKQTKNELESFELMEA